MNLIFIVIATVFLVAGPVSAKQVEDNGTGQYQWWLWKVDASDESKLTGMKAIAEQYGITPEQIMEVAPKGSILAKDVNTAAQDPYVTRRVAKANRNALFWTSLAGFCALAFLLSAIIYFVKSFKKKTVIDDTAFTPTPINPSPKIAPVTVEPKYKKVKFKFAPNGLTVIYRVQMEGGSVVSFSKDGKAVFPLSASTEYRTLKNSVGPSIKRFLNGHSDPDNLIKAYIDAGHIRGEDIKTKQPIALTHGMLATQP